MTDPADHLLNELLAIQKRHKRIFNEIEKDIFSCVYLTWQEPIKLYIITTQLPAQLENEILAIRFDP